MYKSCAFTGHRFCNEKVDKSALERIIKNLIKSGAENFYNGVAMGFDLIAAETILKLKKNYGNIKLIACVPFAEQSSTFDSESLQRYQNILENCDEIIVLSPCFYSGCMHRRNKFLVDNCNVLISFLRKKSGGTFYTVNYAREKGIPIIEL